MQETICIHVIVPTGNVLHKVAQGPDLESGSEEPWPRPEGAELMQVWNK